MKSNRTRLLHETGGERDIHVGDSFVSSVTKIEDGKAIVDIGYVVYVSPCPNGTNVDDIVTVEIHSPFRVAGQFAGSIVETGSKSTFQAPADGVTLHLLQRFLKLKNRDITT